MAFTLLDSAFALGLVLECILYGVYVVLFILYLVLQRRSNQFGGPLALAQILLFGLCTSILFLDIPRGYLLVQIELEPTAPGNRLAIFLKLTVGNGVLSTMIDSLAHMIIFYRCWIIWDKRWTVMAIPGFLLLASLGLEFAEVGLFAGPATATASQFDEKDSVRILTATHFISLVVNALTTSLIVTKIFFTSRAAGPALGSNSHRPLHVINAMLIESGLFMFVFELIFAVLYSIQHPAYATMGLPMFQIYGIAPTLLGVRVAMGSTYDKTTVKTRSLRFAHSAGGAATWATSPSVMDIAGVQFRDINTELSDAPNSEGAAGNAV